jgi:hypothetical protein
MSPVPHCQLAKSSISSFELPKLYFNLPKIKNFAGCPIHEMQFVCCPSFFPKEKIVTHVYYKSFVFHSSMFLLEPNSMWTWFELFCVFEGLSHGVWLIFCLSP